MFFYKKLDSIKLETEKRKGFEMGKDKMRELKNKEIKTLKNRYWEIIREKDNKIKDKNKRVKEIEKSLESMKETIVRLKSFSEQINNEHGTIFLATARKKQITERMNDEIMSLERKFIKEYETVKKDIDDYIIDAKLN